MADEASSSGIVEWLAVIVPTLLGLGAAMWQLGKRLFASVTREELRDTLEEWQSQRIDMHNENKKTLTDLGGELHELSRKVARLEGSLSGRYQRPDQQRDRDR